MKTKKCIFCKSTKGPFLTREHILPESLGGGEWAILPGGLFCDSCQNLFGSTIEQQALADYPFSFFRVFLGIPTKKKKAPWFESWEGTIEAGIKPGTIGYKPSVIFEPASLQGSKSVMRLIAQPRKPEMICRFLLKMALEVIAADNVTDVFEPKFDEARDFAFTGRKTSDWWYLQVENMEDANKHLTNGVTIDDWRKNVALETILVEDGAEVFHIKLLYLDIFVPIESRIQPPEMSDLKEPGFKVYKC